jgi:hypothetical protein
VTTGLGFAGFFFSLLKPVLGMCDHPAVWQEGFQGSRVAGGNDGDPTQHIRQVGPHVHAVPPGTLHQRVKRRRRLPTFLASKEQVVLATDGDGPQEPFNNIVVYGNLSLAGIADEGVEKLQQALPNCKIAYARNRRRTSSRHGSASALPSQSVSSSAQNASIGCIVPAVMSNHVCREGSPGVPSRLSGEATAG